MVDPFGTVVGPVLTLLAWALGTLSLEYDLQVGVDGMSRASLITGCRGLGS